MNLSATGVIILATLAAFTLGSTALILSASRGRILGGLTALLPSALVAGAVVALLLGHRLPWPELAAALPVAVGLLTALFSRSLGYGLLAGLIVAVTTIA